MGSTQSYHGHSTQYYQSPYQHQYIIQYEKTSTLHNPTTELSLLQKLQQCVQSSLDVFSLGKKSPTNELNWDQESDKLNSPYPASTTSGSRLLNDFFNLVMESEDNTCFMDRSGERVTGDYLSTIAIIEDYFDLDRQNELYYRMNMQEDTNDFGPMYQPSPVHLLPLESEKISSVVEDLQKYHQSHSLMDSFQSTVGSSVCSSEQWPYMDIQSLLEEDDSRYPATLSTNDILEEHDDHLSLSSQWDLFSPVNVEMKTTSTSLYLPQKTQSSKVNKYRHPSRSHSVGSHTIPYGKHPINYTKSYSIMIGKNSVPDVKRLHRHKQNNATRIC